MMKPEYPYTQMPIIEKYKKWYECPSRTRCIHFYMLERVMFRYIRILQCTAYIIGMITVPIWGLPYFLFRLLCDYFTK